MVAHDHFVMLVLGTPSYIDLIHRVSVIDNRARDHK